jgi:hypothetical protein
MELHRGLTSSIPDKRDREAFLKFCVAQFQNVDGIETTTPRPPLPTTAPSMIVTTTPSAEPSTEVNWDPAQLETVRQQLALYIGPMAKLLVGRTSSSARSLNELYDLLAAQIPSPADREKFLRGVSPPPVPRAR